MTSYSERAQPFLDAVAQGLFHDQSARDWLVSGSRVAATFHGTKSLHTKQKALRNRTKQPFYCNYFCGLDAKCTCRPTGSKGLETDLMVFLENDSGNILAVHLEFKHPKEKLSTGQAEAYSMRAKCWAMGSYRPQTVMPHHDWLTVLICDPAFHDESDLKWFDKVVSHSDIRLWIAGYPDDI